MIELPNHNPLPKGVLLQGGKYIIEQMLERGSMGFTYLAQCRNVSCDIDRTGWYNTVVIQELYYEKLQKRFSDQRTVVLYKWPPCDEYMCYYNQFRDQACSLMRINHPNWISIIDYFEENGTSYYVSEYVEGETLFNYYYHNELLSEQQVLHAFKCITRVLHKMFRLNIFHANISPKNILIGKDGQVYLKGFGFPILFDDDEDRFIFTDEECNERHLLPGEEFGWNYRYSPEGRRYNLTESYEIYSLGATFYFILTKETPYHINVDFSYQKFSPSIPKYVVDCLAKTMAPRESDRYKSLDELITALGLSVSEIESIGQSQETNNSFYANPVLAVDSNKEGLTTVYNDLKQQNVLPYGTILEGNGY